LQAKKLKFLQDAIKSVGGQLAQLVSDKARAVEDEDYDQAAQLKNEIGRIRASLNQQLVEAGMRGAGTFGGPKMASSSPPYAGRGGYGAPGQLEDNRPLRARDEPAEIEIISPRSNHPSPRGTVKLKSHATCCALSIDIIFCLQLRITDALCPEPFDQQGPALWSRHLQKMKHPLHLRRLFGPPLQRLPLHVFRMMRMALSQPHPLGRRATLQL
jgi:hypothetical protein